MRLTRTSSDQAKHQVHADSTNRTDQGTRSTWILLIVLSAVTVFFFWGVEARVPWVLRVLEWAATVF